MHEPSNENIDHVTDRGEAPAFVPGTPLERAAQSDILRVLADFQSGLESLKDLHSQRERLQAELVEKHRELTERDMQIQSRQAEFDDVRRALEERENAFQQALRQHAEDKAAAEALLAEARESQEARAEDLSKLAARLEQQERALTESRKRLTEREGEVARLRAELDASLTASQQSLRRAGDLGQEAAELREELEKERAAAEDLQRLLAAAQGRNKGESVRADDAAKRAAEVEALVATLKNANAELEKRLADLATRYKQAQSEALMARQALENAPTRRDSFLEHRRARLRNYRVAVRRQMLKVRKASEALSKRMEQVDQVLQQRAELAAARQRIIEAEKRVGRARARTRAGVVTFCAVGVLAILAGLSWAVAREVAPGRYMAEVTLKADGRGRDLNAGELEEWRRYHLGLLGDPMFQNAAAERFARQGLVGLGTPAAVSGLVTSAVLADSMADDEIRITIEGAGSDRTRRTLEAFSASIASYANAAQQRRIDGGATIIPAPARVDLHPMDNTRTVWALVMMATGTIFSLVLALTVWKKLAHAKSRFEHDSLVASALDEARWVDPR